MVRCNLTSSKTVRSKSCCGTWSKHICFPDCVLKFLSHLTAAYQVEEKSSECLFSIKMPVWGGIFRFCISPGFLSWLIIGDSLIWRFYFHQRRRTVCEDMGLMRFSFWQMWRGKNVIVYHSDFPSIHLSVFICLLPNLLLISVSPVARPIMTVSADQCCSIGVSATARS